MKGYTVGFILSADQTEVVLVTKTHPDWQKGRLNGIGGKIEDGESSAECMVRESREESGLASKAGEWRHFLKMKRPDLFVDFYVYVSPSGKAVVSAQTDEAINWYSVKALPQECLSNIHWMVPLALDTLNDKKLSFTEVEYNDER